MSTTAAPQDESHSAATKGRTAARPVPAGSARTADGVELALYRWPSATPAKATVALLHGLAEHAGRYAAVAERLGAAGIELVALSPGLSPLAQDLVPLIASARERGIPVWGELEFFAQALAPLGDKPDRAPEQQRDKAKG